MSKAHTIRIMLSISASTSSQIISLNLGRRGGGRREPRCVGHRPPGRLRDSGARLTGRPAHPASTSSRTAAPHSAYGLTPMAGPLSSTAAGRSRLPVLPRSVNAIIPRSPLLRDEAVYSIQGALTASLRRMRSSHRHISGITPQSSQGIPPHRHPASSSRPLCDRHWAGSASPPLPRCRPRRTRSLRSLACHRARLGPSGNAHPVGSVAATAHRKPSLARTSSAPERRAEILYTMFEKILLSF